MGMTATHVTVLPDDEIGNAAMAELSARGVNTEYIQRAPGRIGMYFYENAASLRSPKIIYDRFHSAFGAIQPGSVDWEQVLAGADWFHWTGITPAVSANAARVCKEALLAARKKGAKISGDINYRRVLWQYGKSAQDVMPELIEYCDVMVGGVEDFKNCAGIDETSFEKACEKIVKQFPSVKKIATTFRETIDASHQFIDAALWSKSVLLKSSRYELFPIVDRIGAGDAFMAGLIVGEISGKTDSQTLEFATAACALKHTIEGDVNIASLEEIEALSQNNNTGKLLR
jgi:2-dehydro-3-deoxygluconokinase